MLVARRNQPGLALALTLFLAASLLRAEEVPLETLLAERRYEEALASLLVRSEEWALEARSSDSPETRLDWARSLLSLGMVEDRLARYDSALEHLQHAHTLLQENGGADSLRGDCLDAMGLAASHAGRFAEAEKHFRAAIALRLAAPEAEREPWLSASRDHLGLAYLEEGRYEESGTLFHQSLEATDPEDDGLLAQRLGYLARYYHTLHNYARARDLLVEALGKAEAAWGRDAPNTLTLLDQLGLTTLRLGDHPEARAILEEAAELARAQATDTTGILRLAGFLNNLGSLNLLEGKPGEAEVPFRESLQLLEQKLGPDHLALAPLRNNLACTLQDLGEFEAAAALFRQCREAYLNRVGPDHQRSVEALANLALNTLLQVGPTAARAEIAEASTAAEQVLNRLLRFGTERQRLNYLQNVDVLSLACSAGEDPVLIANILLATKGRLLDVLLAEGRREPTPALREYQITRQQLDRLLLTASDPAGREPEALRTQLLALERQLAAEPAAISATRPVTWQDVQATLPVGSAFIDFVRYADHTADPRRELRYGAVLILPEGPPQWISLASETTLQTWLEVLARRLEFRAARLGGEDSAAPVLNLKPGLRELHDQFWKPLEQLLPEGTRTLCLCPDASLNFLSFSVLLGEDNRFLADRYPLCTYVASGRDLLLPPREADLRAAPAQIFAVDAFAEAPAAAAGTSYQQQLVEAIAGLDPLAGAKREVEEITPFLPTASAVHQGAEATEDALRAIAPSPAVLHLVTHGFFLGDHGAGPTQSRLQDFDADPRPLYRSGLVLQGAKQSLAASEPPDPLRDDILFASDVATLPLHDTELVALSSCQSALGESLAGEGVLGLRRGFAIAGARNLLLTLWPVSDATTPDYMRRFYELAAETKHLSQAAWQAQREGLAAIDPDDPEELEQAVLTLGPFLLCQRQGLLPIRSFTPPTSPLARWPLWIGLLGGLILAALFYRVTHPARRR